MSSADVKIEMSVETSRRRNRKFEPALFLLHSESDESSWFLYRTIQKYYLDYVIGPCKM